MIYAACFCPMVLWQHFGYYRKREVGQIGFDEVGPNKMSYEDIQGWILEKSDFDNLN